MLLTWLKESKNSFLAWFGNKTNRTTFQFIELEVGETTKELQCPYGTWSFDIRVVATKKAMLYSIIHQGGGEEIFQAESLADVGKTNRLIYDGQPYIERQDRFKVRNDTDEVLFVYISYHRVMTANT